MKKYLGLILLSSVTTVLIQADSAQAAKKETPKVKIRIAHSLPEVSISGTDISRYFWTDKTHKEFAGKKTINFNCRPSKKVKRQVKPIRLATIESMTGLLDWDKEKFKGKMHVQTSENFKGCDLINEVSLEDYLSTLLPKEMSASWPIEALKAQAVAARSYAFYKIKTQQVSKTKGFNTYYDLENSEKHQVNGSYFDATKKTFKATKETRGQVLSLFNGKTPPIFFHSKCGGKTLRPDQVWNNFIPGYKGVTCPFCHEHGKKNWSHKFKQTDIRDYLFKALEKFENDKITAKGNRIRLIKDHKANNQLKFYSGDNFKVIKKSRLRGIMGRKSIPSNYFNLRRNGKEIEISGSGYGHGVGMCQFGAKELADNGYTYKQILAHYFPGMKLKEIY